MRGRLASLSFFLASAAVAVAWLTLLPVLTGLFDALRHAAAPGSAESELLDRVRGVLPLYLAVDLVLIAVVCFAILYLALGRPLRGVEAAIEQLGAHRWDLPLASGGGPTRAQEREGGGRHPQHGGGARRSRAALAGDAEPAPQRRTGDGRPGHG